MTSSALVRMVRFIHCWTGSWRIGSICDGRDENIRTNVQDTRCRRRPRSQPWQDVIILPDTGNPLPRKSWLS